MKNTFIPVIIFLFTSPYYTLFAAHEFGLPLSLYAGGGSSSQLSFAEPASGGQLISQRASDSLQLLVSEPSLLRVGSGSKNGRKRDSLQPRVYDEQLTAKLEELFKKLKNIGWHETSDSKIISAPDWRKNSSKMRSMLDGRANPDVGGPGDGFLLSEVCLKGDIKFARACIANGASLESTDMWKKTP